MTEINTNPKELKFWQDRVAKSDGRAFFLPEELVTELKEVIELENEAKRLSNQVAELQIKGQTRMNALWLKFREFLAANGKPENWLLEVGLDQVAMENGFYVVNVLERNNR